MDNQTLPQSPVVPAIHAALTAQLDLHPETNSIVVYAHRRPNGEYYIDTIDGTGALTVAVDVGGGVKCGIAGPLDLHDKVNIIIAIARGLELGAGGLEIASALLPGEGA